MLTGRTRIDESFEREAAIVLTVLFVLVILAIAVKVTAVFDAQRVAASEINSYLRYEYQMDSTANAPLTQLRSI